MNPLKAIKNAVSRELDRHTVYELPETFMVDDIKQGYGNTVIVKTQLSAIHRGAKPKTVEFALEVSPEQHEELFYQQAAKEAVADSRRVFVVENLLQEKKRLEVRNKTGLSAEFTDKTFMTHSRTNMPIIICLDEGKQLVRGSDLDLNNSLGTRKLKARIEVISDYSGAGIKEIVDLARTDISKVGKILFDSKKHMNARMPVLSLG